MSLPSLRPCARAGCRRLTHLRYCPEHVDADQRDLASLRDETLLELDLARDRVQELEQAVGVIERRLGVERP